jgi:hypothetical protein
MFVFGTVRQTGITRFAHMFLVPFDRSLVPSPYGAVRLLFKFRSVSNFSIFATQRSELTLPQPGAQRQDIFHWFYKGKLMRAPEDLSTGLQRAPDRGCVYLQKFSAKTAFA